MLANKRSCLLRSRHQQTQSTTGSNCSAQQLGRDSPMQLSSNLFISVKKPLISFTPRFSYSPESNSVQAESLKTLEWSSICKQLSAFTSTSMASSTAINARLPIGQTPHESQKLLDQTSAARLVTQPLDFSGIHDLTEIIAVAVSGQLLTIPELCTVRRTLTAARELLEALKHAANHQQR